MEIRVERKWPKAGYTIGNLYVNDAKLCNTLEDEDRGLMQSQPLDYIKYNKVYGDTAIPKGRYRVDMRTVSPKFKSKNWAQPYKGIVPRLVGVPGFDGVLIHPGTTSKDTLGCILVGKNTIVGGVTKSQETFHTLMKQFLVPADLRNEPIYITIE